MSRGAIHERSLSDGFERGPLRKTVRARFNMPLGLLVADSKEKELSAKGNSMTLVPGIAFEAQG
jgi:hypothetical protein